MTLQFGRYTVDTQRRELRGDGVLIHVEPQVFDVLTYLAEHRNRVISKDELFEMVWKGRIVSDATLSSRINAARRAIGDTGEQQSLIRTVPRRGFLFAGEVATDDSSKSVPTPRTAGQAARQQKVTFCKSADRVNLAVATVGEGPPLVKTGNWLNHLEYDWQSPVWRVLFQELSADHQLIRYDARGSGLSDRSVAEISFDLFVRDLETVIDAQGSSAVRCLAFRKARQLRLPTRRATPSGSRGSSSTAAMRRGTGNAARPRITSRRTPS